MRSSYNTRAACLGKQPDPQSDIKQQAAIFKKKPSGGHDEESESGSINGSVNVYQC